VADEVIMPDTEAMIWSMHARHRAGQSLLVMMHSHGGVEHDMAHTFASLPAGESSRCHFAGLCLCVTAGRGSITNGKRALRSTPQHAACWPGSRRCGSTSPSACSVFSQGGAMAIQLMRLAWLRRHATLTERTYPRLDHSISGEVVADATEFIIDQVG